MSSSSGEVPAGRSVVGSSGSNAAAEVSHVFVCKRFHFFLLTTFLFTSPSLLVFLCRQHMERLVPVLIEVLAERNVDVSSGADAAAEVSHILFSKKFFFF